MAKWTTKQIKDLNRSSTANQNVSLGTTLGNFFGSGTVVSASHTVTNAEMSASRVVLTTGLTAVTGFYNSYLRSGSVVTPTWASGSVAGTITIVNSASGSPTTGDVAAYMAF